MILNTLRYKSYSVAQLKIKKNTHPHTKKSVKKRQTLFGPTCEKAIALSMSNDLNGQLTRPSLVLTGWESLHWRNDSFWEHNALFLADKQICSFYTYNTAPAEYRWPQWYDDRIISYQHLAVRDKWTAKENFILMDWVITFRKILIKPEKGGGIQLKVRELKDQEACN